MKSFKYIAMLTILGSFISSCSSAQKLQEKSPVSINEVYSQSWVAGIEGGGSGINLFISVSNELPKGIQLDSVYFKGKATNLEKIEGENLLYVGRFRSEANQTKDIVMSSDPNEEYGNSLPIIATKNHFEITDSECVISYKKGKSIKYFKIENISEKAPQYYPSAPPNRQ